MEDFGFGGGILGWVSGAEGVILEVGFQFGDGAEEEGVVEVEIGDTLGMGCEAFFVAGEIGSPISCGLVEVVGTDVGGDRGVHARDDAVKDTLFEAFVIVNSEACGGGIGLLDDTTEVVGGLEDAKGVRVDIRARDGSVFGEAVLLVDGVPYVAASVASETLWVVDEGDVVALCSGRFVLWDAVVTLVAFIVVFDNTAFSDVFSEGALKWLFFAPFFLEFLARVSGFGAF